MRPVRARLDQQGSDSSETAVARWPPSVFGALTADGHDVALSGLFDHEPLTEGILGRNHLATGGIGTGGRKGGVLVWTCHCLLTSDTAFLYAVCFFLTLLHFASSWSFLLTIPLGISLGFLERSRRSVRHDMRYFFTFDIRVTVRSGKDINSLYHTPLWPMRGVWRQ